MRLEGNVAVITGGAGGIGWDAARLFCEEGARVVLVDREQGLADEAAANVRAAVGHAEIVAVGADLALESSAKVVTDAAVSAYGRLDILVNNAAMRSYERLAEARAETWHAILAVNLLSYAYMAREALPHLRKTGSGSIVNVSSTHAVNPRGGMGQYDVTKAGIVSMTRSLANEEAPHGVRVNAVCPGPTLTTFHVRRAEAGGGTAADLEKEHRRDCMLGRWAAPREVAYPILWLASKEASFVTGTALMVDGGMPVI